MPIGIAITGAGGRMGRRLIALSHDAGCRVVAAIDRPEGPFIGRDAGELAGIGPMNLAVADDISSKPAVLIDFTNAAATGHWLQICQDRRIAMVIGTTGLGDAEHAAIDAAAADIPILQAPNMSLGVNLLFKLVADAAKILGDDYDIEIVEAHHRFKKDAPSGTAMGIADSILNATGKDRRSLVYDRHGDDSARRRGQIAMHALRMGDEIGRHTTYFAALGERLELTHVASNRDTFVHGALRAANWLAHKTPGRYTMMSVLGL